MEFAGMMNHLKPSYDFFSGMGGSMQGHRQSKLYTELDCDLMGIEINEKVASIASSNGHNTLVADILSLDDTFYELLMQLGAFKMHFSSPCQKYSRSNANLRKMVNEGIEIKEDLTFAHAIIKIIYHGRPDYITIENVRDYQNSMSMMLIRELLVKLGYTFTEDVYNCHDYGVPQSRVRYFLMAKLNDNPNELTPYPVADDEKLSWYRTCNLLIPMLEDWELAPWQKEILPEVMNWKHHVIDGTKGSYGTNITTRSEDEPVHTIVASQNRKPLKILLPGDRPDTPTVERRVKRVSYDFLKVWQSFPWSYKLSGHNPTDSMGIGNAVPCKFMQQACDAIYDDYMIEQEMQR